MNKHSNQIADLHSKLVFTIIDMRGFKGFPRGPEGVVYQHHDQRVLKAEYTGISRQQNDIYLIRTDATGQGWRIDKQDIVPVTVRGLDGKEYWANPIEAAEALGLVLEKVKS